LAPAITVEAVLQADPEVIVAGARGAGEAGGLGMWKRYPGLLAARRGNLFTIESDLIGRAGPRMIDGAERLCKLLDQARARRNGPR
jgi:iron complex transport system substrate-binding protein